MNELHTWELNPTWIDQESVIWDFTWPELQQDESEQWNKCFPNGIKFISSLCLSVAEQSTVAHVRYSHLNGLERLTEQWPLLAVLLAEVHLLMNDSFGASRLLTRAQSQIGGQGVDEVLDKGVIFLGELMEMNDCDEDMPSDPTFKVHRYDRKDAQLEPSFVTNWSSTFNSWERLTDSGLTDMLARYVSITTNEIEDVFSLNASSSKNLVKQGFHVKYISEFLTQSRTTDKSKVIDILQNTNSCFKELRFNSNELDAELVKAIHSKLLLNDNIHKETIDGMEFYQLVPRGEFRHQFCYAIDEVNKREIHYCPWKSIGEEMDNFFSTAQQMLERTDLDPFYVSAWIQWAFLYIHPFADGNGRVARMISSIPLLKRNLPPVVVVQERKSEYFDALFLADEQGNLAPLAMFLQMEADAAIAYIRSLDVDIETESRQNFP